MAVVFVDTSIFCSLLRIPGKCSGRELVWEEYERRSQAGDVLVLPVAAIIETGNHIEQLPESLGYERRRCAQGLCDILRSIANGVRPWVVPDVPWNGDLLRRFCDGGAQSPAFMAVALPGHLGGGDLSILVERDFYREHRAEVPVEVWTLDEQLRSYT